MQAVQEVRSLPRREALVVRGVVDPRLHPQVHPEQLAPGEDRHHAGAAQAVLQPAQGEGEARAAGLRRPRPKRSPSALDVPESEVDRDGAAARRRARCRSTRRVGRDDEGGALAPRHAASRRATRAPTCAAEARRVPRAAAREARGVREDAARARADHLPRAPAHRVAADAAGDRRALRHQPRARAPAREAADRQAARRTCAQELGDAVQIAMGLEE